MKIMVAVVLVLIGLAGFAFLAAWPTWWLWNWLCPVLFGLPEIGFFQALGLNLLCGILFKGGGTSSS
jgi:hypothetical protein